MTMQFAVVATKGAASGYDGFGRGVGNNRERKKQHKLHANG